MSNRKFGECRGPAAVLAGLVLVLTAVGAGSPPHKSVGAIHDQPAPSPTPRVYAGLDNVIECAPGVLSGSSPRGEVGFESLSALGVRTVISVGGGRPDLSLAASRGMRYVHLPIRYNGIDEERLLELARAVRDMPRPIYIHCHHGMHRGPAAAAAALVGIGEISPDEGGVLLRLAGTSAAYTGLHTCVATARVLDAEAIESIPLDLPEFAEVKGMVASMAAMDRAIAHLELIKDAGWRPPTDHPDLVPAAEAGALYDLLRELTLDPDAAAYPEGFSRLLREAAAHALDLERALRREAGAATAQAASSLRGVNNACRACHRAHREGAFEIRR